MSYQQLEHETKILEQQLERYQVAPKPPDQINEAYVRGIREKISTDKKILQILKQEGKI